MSEQVSATSVGIVERGKTVRRIGRGPSARRVFAPLIALVVFLGTWEIAVQSGFILDLILPPPSQVVETFGESLLSIITGGPMLGHVGTTLTEVLGGFFISIVIGVAIAVLMSEFRWSRDALYPFIVAFNATPTIALAPLFIVWFGVGIESKIILVITGATFPIIVSTMAGLLSTSDELLRLMRSMGATRWEIFRRVRIQSSMPYFFSGLELAIVSAAIGAVVGEFSGGNSGLGYITLLAQDAYNLDLAFSTLLLLALMGIILHRLVVLVRDKVVFWTPGGSK